MIILWVYFQRRYKTSYLKNTVWSIFLVFLLRPPQTELYRGGQHQSVSSRCLSDCLLPELTAKSNRVVIVVPPRNTTVMLGRPAVMECMAEGQPKPLVSWSRQGKSWNTLLCCLALWFIRDEVSVSTCSINKESTHTW